jgi:hypothetical protein
MNAEEDSESVYGEFTQTRFQWKGEENEDFRRERPTAEVSSAQINS